MNLYMQKARYNLQSLLMGAVLALLAVAVLQPPRIVRATARPLQSLSSASLTAAITPTLVPGVYCTVTVWNPSATRVWVGGSTVTASTGLPICTDSTVCPSGSVFTADVLGDGLNGLFVIASGAPLSGLRILRGTGC